MHPLKQGAFFMPDGAINTGISQEGEERKNEKKIF